jgi:hypothetical protein
MKKTVSIRVYYTPYLFLFTHLDFLLISRTCYASSLYRTQDPGPRAQDPLVSSFRFS